MSTYNISKFALRQQFQTDSHLLVTFSNIKRSTNELIYPAERKVCGWMLGQILKDKNDYRIQIKQEDIARINGVSISTVKNAFKLMRLLKMLQSYRWFKQASAHTPGLFLKDLKDYTHLIELFPNITSIVSDLLFRRRILDKQSNCLTISSYSSISLKNSLLRNINVDVRKSYAPSSIGNLLQKLLTPQMIERDEGKTNQNYLKRESPISIATRPAISQNKQTIAEHTVSENTERIDLLKSIKRKIEAENAGYDTYEMHPTDTNYRWYLSYKKIRERAEQRLKEYDTRNALPFKKAEFYERE
jgi:hypothetical protein